MAEYYPKVGVCYEHSESSKIYMIYTFACNAACDHCLVESNPRRRAKIGLDKAKDIVRLGAEYGKSFLDMSGGEAMLFPEEIKEIFRTARDLGYFIVLNTNAYWARTPETTRRILGELQEAGLRGIFPSASAYHSKYVPLERVRNIREACQTMDVTYELNYFYSADKSVDEQLMKDLDLADEVFFYEGLQTTANNKDTLGRLKEAYLRRTPEELDDALSVHLGVNPHGHVVSSCNMNYNNDKFRGTPFFVGDFTQTPFEDILKAERSSQVLQFVYANPHPAMHHLLAKDSEVGDYHRDQFADRRYYTVVDYYLDLFKDPKIMRRLEEVLPVPV